MLEFTIERGPIGIIARSGNVIAFFGDRGADEAAVAVAFPQFHFCYLQQTHSSIVLERGSQDAVARPEGDAHWTTERGVALAIRTADCLPVLFASTAGVIAAAHAGWRGVEGEILARTVGAVSRGRVAARDLTALIGPGIGPVSFEVGREGAQRLEAVFVRSSGHGTALLPHSNLGKNKVNLVTIANAQLLASGLLAPNIHDQSIDTLVDQSFWSYRRDGATAGRQVSFIARE